MFHALLDCYVDDPHVCLPLRPVNPRNPVALVNCLQEVDLWMTEDFLKTEQLKNRSSFKPSKPLQPISAD